MPAGDTDDAGPAAAGQTEVLPAVELANADGIGAKRPAQPTPVPMPSKRSTLHDTRGWPTASDDAKCFHFIELTQSYLTDDMSDEYQRVLRRAARLTPAERAALLTALASMIQEDQTKSLTYARCWNIPS